MEVEAVASPQIPWTPKESVNERVGYTGCECAEVAGVKGKYFLKVKIMTLMLVSNEHKSKILFNSFINEKNS